MLRIFIIGMSLSLLSACDNSCDKLEAKLCATGPGGSEPNCEVIRVKERRAALNEDVCAGILKRMRE